ncbi:MAG: hypothetical protein JRN20_04655 [Nitrososphaerota archaeon]|nr:hypothetical protein [Nitrososphaerota archaeon]
MQADSGIGTNSAGLSKIVAIVIALVLAVVAIAGIYFAMSGYFNNAASEISVEALSLDTSSSNLSSTVNVNSQSPLVRIDLYVNGTFIGYCNYSWHGSTMMSNGIPLTTRNWNNGTYSMMFSISPQYFPRMSQIRMMTGAEYDIEMVAHFQNGATCTVNRWMYVNNSGFSGMMGSGAAAWWSGMMGRYFSVQTIPINDVINDMHNPPSNANIFKSNDTIIFSGTQNVTILAIGMMPDDATNLTGMTPPSYASDDVFVIYGLIDPTLVIPSGARVNLIFANSDDDMYHNFVVTSLGPPYYYMPIQGMMFSNSSSWYGGGMMGGRSNSPLFGTTMPLLSPVNDGQGTAYYYATTFSLYSYSANYWYICTYPGHAQSGMYGRIFVSS